MPKKHLTNQLIKNLKSDPQNPKRIEYYDQHLIKNNTLKSTGVKGLFIRLTKAGSIYFYYRYWFNQKPKSYKIGDYPNIGLSDARDQARELAIKVNNGKDPQAEKKKEKYKPKEMTFKELANIFSKRFLPEKKESTRDAYQRIIDKELLKKHKWGNIQISDITSQHVRDVLNHKAHKEGYFTMANRMRSTISKIFEYGLKHVGLNLKENPVKNTPIFKQGENVRKRVYSEDEIKELWDFWETKPEPIQSVYKMLLLTGQRKTETMHMCWDDIQWDKPCKRMEIGSNGQMKPEAFLADIWTITDNKSDRIHEIPLPYKAKEVIENLKPLTGKSDYVFCSPRLDNQPLKSIKSTTRMVKRATSVSDFRPHDLRRTVNTKLSEMMIDETVRKKILNHKIEGVNAEHYNWYNYNDQKLEALQRWARRVDAIISDKEQETTIHKIG